MTFAGKSTTPHEIRTTINFLRSTSRTSRSRAAWLVNMAINRKAGIPDVACRKQESDYQTWLMRDARRLRDIRNRIRVYQFESPEVRARFSHLLSRYDD